MSSRAVAYPWPAELPRSPDYRLWIDNIEVPVLHTPVGSIASFGLQDPAPAVVEVARPFQVAVLRPLSRGLSCTRDGARLTISVDKPGYLSLELDGDIGRPLLILADPPERDRPSPRAEGVKYFAAGRIHALDRVTLRSGETLYLEPGAVLMAQVTAQDVRDITMCGRGMILGREPGVTGRPAWRITTDLVGCQDVTVDGIMQLDSPGCNMLVVGCERVKITNTKLIAWSPSDDGIPLVSSRDVSVAACFIRTKDDCIPIKASDRGRCQGKGLRDVRGISIVNSVLWNAEWGNALEIGFETLCDAMSDIRFSNCDILHCGFEGHESGAVLSIHNGDRADIHHVRYDDIRVEDAQQKLIDLKILHSQYTKDDKRGRIHDILFRNVRVVDGPFPVSIIRGHHGSGDQVIRDVTFEGLDILGTLPRDWREARMVTEITAGVRFCPAA